MFYAVIKESKPGTVTPVISLLNEFVQNHHLPDAYRQTAENFFIPLCHQIARQANKQQSPLVVGIHGCQGSGKSTLTDFLLFLFDRYYHLHAVGMSIDDFYLTRDERAELSNRVHPLFKTRGVPGTHDMALLKSVLLALKEGRLPVAIPRFNKAIDDRCPESDWSMVNTAVDVIILEGWCVGSLPEPDSKLDKSKNTLERDEDSEEIWRRYANQQLAGPYRSLFDQLDQLIMLKAPGFHTVHQWRLEQEQRLLAALPKEADRSQLMSEAAVARFIQHYQRITEYSLATLPGLADVVFELDESRSIVNQTSREQ